MLEVQEQGICFWKRLVFLFCTIIYVTVRERGRLQQNDLLLWCKDVLSVQGEGGWLRTFLWQGKSIKY